jgi:hypothetical protein
MSKTNKPSDPGLVLPDFYKRLRPGESLVPMEPDEQLPDHYFVGDTAPLDEIKAQGLDKDTSEPIYWLNPETHELKQYIKNKWTTVTDPKVPAYVVDDEGEAFAKIIKVPTTDEVRTPKPKPGPVIPQTSFDDALKLAKEIADE